ncbi:putative membrane protein [Propionispora sp. 2/2-37]|uniref:signal peptidase II n=1 Tax=Propionispora sp. 2/2-37 TaxID=1677858 RepID=UPI0006BB9161|nr:signal peptidase II [Propionispora sp. 2/2-37]CUH94198.1 putative membrane protein [Propionispora sp. 2/2-37]
MPILLLSILIIVLDQLTKYYVQTHMLPGMSIPLIQNVFHLTYVLNPGAAFGILEHKTAFFVVIAGMMIAGVFWFYPRIPAGNLLLRVGIAFMVGGAIGNVIDRVRTSYVVDFFDFRIWPVFNIADIAIVTGVFFIIIHIIYFQKGTE